MRLRSLLVCFLALALIYITWRFIREPEPPKGPPALKYASQTGPKLKKGKSAAAAVQIPRPESATIKITEHKRGGLAVRDRQARRAASWEIVATIYGPFLDELNVSSEVRQQVLELACDERQAAYEVVAVANTEKLGYLSNPQVQRMALDAATSEDARIRDLLLADDFKKFADYRSMQAIQVSVSKLLDNISDSGGAQLTDSQVRALTKIFYDAQTPGQLLRAPINAVLNLAGVGVTEPIINSARSLLSEQQLAALMQVRDGQSVPSHNTIGARPAPVTRH